MFNWTKKTMTWGGYMKFSGICTLIGVLITAGTWVYYFWDDISEFVTSKFKRWIQK